jgi:uncharacterized protein (DUF1697 family)
MMAVIRCAAFLRNVIIGRKGLTQEVLLGAFLAGGAQEAASVLATGNVFFTCEEGTETQVAARAAAALAEQIGLYEPFFVRTLSALRELVAADPFAVAPAGEIYERCITFLPEAGLPVGELPYMSPRRDCAIFARTATEVFSITHLINHRPGQPGKWIEQQAGTPVTTRNWNTVIRILQRYGED